MREAEDGKGNNDSHTTLPNGDASEKLASMSTNGGNKLMHRSYVRIISDVDAHKIAMLPVH